MRVCPCPSPHTHPLLHSFAGPARTELLGRSAANAVIAGASGCFFMTLVNKFAWRRTLEPLPVLNGLRAGLVSIASGLGLVHPWSAFVIACVHFFSFSRLFCSTFRCFCCSCF